MNIQQSYAVYLFAAELIRSTVEIVFKFGCYLFDTRIGAARGKQQCRRCQEISSGNIHRLAFVM
jgi:hypothetical protein